MQNFHSIMHFKLDQCNHDNRINIKISMKLQYVLHDTFIYNIEIKFHDII